MICPSTTKKLFDFDKNLIEINSNISINFALCDNITLPKDSKIEILETHVEYSISNVEKLLLINGRKIDCDKLSLYDCISLKEHWINVPKDNKNKILLSMIESLDLKINLCVEIKAVAHTPNCEKIYFRAIGNSMDLVKTTLINKCCIPFSCYNFKKTYIELNSCLVTTTNPNYIFLSPLYDCNSNINYLLGNVFVNHKIEFESICYKNVKKYFCNPFSKPCYKKQ